MTPSARTFVIFILLLAAAAITGCGLEPKAVQRASEVCQSVTNENWHKAEWKMSDRDSKTWCEQSLAVYPTSWEYVPCTLGEMPFLCRTLDDGSIFVAQTSGERATLVKPEDRERIGDGLKIIGQEETAQALDITYVGSYERMREMGMFAFDLNDGDATLIIWPSDDSKNPNGGSSSISPDTRNMRLRWFDKNNRLAPAPLGLRVCADDGRCWPAGESFDPKGLRHLTVHFPF